MFDFLRSFAGGVWAALKAAQRGTGMVIFVLFLYLVFGALFGDNRPTVPNKVALVFDPVGFVVEQPRERERLEILFQDESDTPPEVRLRDVSHVLRSAITDDRIKAVVLDVDYLFPNGPANTHYIADLVRQVRESGKNVIAYGNSFNQAQYLIAAQANEVYMNPQGSVLLSGYGIYPTYMQAGLEMIGAEFTVFRVGDYKSMGDPYLFNEMPEASRDSNGGLINSLWQDYVADVSLARGFEDGELDAKIANISNDLAASGGSFAEYALAAGLIDGLKTRQDWQRYRRETLTEAQDSGVFRTISFDNYLAATDNDESYGDPEVAIVIAEGALLDGEQPTGIAGGDTVARHLREARTDRDVKAVVLRVDSPGGSVFASDVVRQEMELLKASGKPLIVSMGNMAASGGYWISAVADEIWAQPTTITGSIGIVAVIPSFSGTLDKLGLHVDGIGTTQLSSGFHPGLPLSDAVRDLIQQSIHNGYNQFVSLVSQGRNMEADAVDSVGQGRVWAGRAAATLGLVDHQGNLDDAIASAAERAGLDAFSVRYIEDQPDFGNQMLEYLFSASVPKLDRTLMARDSLGVAYAKELIADMEGILALNDPTNIYALCLSCRVR